MFSSTIIPTIGRPSLARAVESVLSQELPGDGFEVIVVNDSGRRLTDGDWQHNNRVRVVRTNRCERSVARNTGAALARGEYLHFLDDDDWLLPGALERFRELAISTQAALVYGCAELVDEVGKRVVRLNLGRSGNCFCPVMAGEWIPIGSFAVHQEDFFAVGGFHPLIRVGEDIDLCRRIALRKDFANSPDPVVAILRGDSWNSTTLQQLAWECSNRGANRILGERGAFRRLVRSADSSYWYGRILRRYLGAVVWSLRERHPSVALSRLFYGAMGTLVAGPRLLSKAFWKGLTTSHISGMDRNEVSLDQEALELSRREATLRQRFL